MSRHRYPRRVVHEALDPWAVGFTIAAALLLVAASLYAYLW